eukprot:CAMPEP_0170739488 /NCGR_PEP_ID=MMETSP0437-20130122/5191_1 /TAXON_ID=0 /ORGANISM="Sexangularia sp." /LENGTH=606 /DNA_ID=CAMNT_0011077953 /DNA_START=193 /DNA_END=2011 /DNA_ORIENTATION=+
MANELSSVSSLLSALDSLGSSPSSNRSWPAAEPVLEALSNSGSHRYGRSRSCSDSTETFSFAESDWERTEHEAPRLLSTTASRTAQVNGRTLTSSFYARFIKDTQAQWDFYAAKWRPDILEPMSVDDVSDTSYHHEGVVGAGTYGVVAKMHDRRSDVMVAAKIFRKFDKNGETALSTLHHSFEHEVSMLLHVPPHRNIVSLHRIFVTDEILVILTPFYQTDLFHLRQQVSKSGGALAWFTLPQIKGIMLQLFSALAHLHDAGVLHRDVTSANVMYHSDGLIRLVDFGIARSCVQVPVPEQANLVLPCHSPYYTTGMTALWFRAPELLMSNSLGYDAGVDIWGAACVFGELLFRKVLLPGHNDKDQLFLSSFICGHRWETSSFKPPTPDASIDQERRKTLVDAVARKCPDAVNSGVVELLADCLFVYDPADRWAAGRLVNHPFFTTTLPRPAPPSEMPRFADRDATQAASCNPASRRSSKIFTDADAGAAPPPPRQDGDDADVKKKAAPTSLSRIRRLSKRVEERIADSSSAGESSDTETPRRTRTPRRARREAREKLEETPEKADDDGGGEPPNGLSDAQPSSQRTATREQDTRAALCQRTDDTLP